VEDRDDIRSTAEADAATESAVLQQVLDLHPTAVTVEELVREFDAGAGPPSERDAVERAVRDLVAAGLLHHNEPFVLPTRAALRYEQLLGG
jgi:hypothetical protein